MPLFVFIVFTLIRIDIYSYSYFFIERDYQELLKSHHLGGLADLEGLHAYSSSSNIEMHDSNAQLKDVDDANENANGSARMSP